MTQDVDVPRCSICDVDDAVIECSGHDTHGFCRECFQGYAKANFELNAEYERERNRGGLVSSAGNLPCPHFIQGTCNCTDIPSSMLRRFVDDDTFDMWRQADVRISMAVIERDQQEAEARREEAEEQRTPLENLRDAVQEALTKGGTVCCPQCKTKGEKDDQCMHIKCESCSTEWCYCCGRPRGNHRTPLFCSRESGCDSIGPYLESQPGWDNFAMRDESPGQGALSEFHRLRIAYFLKQLKQSTDEALWAELRAAHPDILSDVPTEGRRVDWDDIDAAEIPTFGETRPVDVRWAEEGREILADLEERRREALERQEDLELQSNRHTILQRRFAQYLATNVSRSGWIFTTVHFLCIFNLLCASIAVQEEVIKVCLASILCLYIIVLLSRVVGSAIDWRYLVLVSQEDERVLPYAEVQFCGSRDEVPYLSSAGRWSKMKWIYLCVLFVCLAFGVFLTIFFQGWSHVRCISNYGVCGLGPAVLAFAGMFFGGGTLLMNLSPPPEASGRRYQTFRTTMYKLILFGAVLVPVGIYLMVGYTDPYRYQTGWIAGAITLGLSTAITLGDLSNRYLSPRGFALDRGVFLSNRRHLAVWFLIILGLFFLGTSERNFERLRFGAVLSLGPMLFVLIDKIRSTNN